RSKVQELTAVLGSSHTYRAERHATQRLAHDLVNEIKGLDPRITLSMLSAELKRHVRPSKRHAMTPERLAEIKLDPGSYSTEAAERNWRLRNRTRKDFTKRQPAAMDLHVPGRERLAREVEYLLGNAEAEKLARNKVHEVALRHGMTFHKLRKLLLKEASLLGLERAAKRLASVKPPTKQLLGWVSRDYGTQRAKYHLAEAAPESIAEREKERERIELERQRVRKEILNSKPGKATNPQMFLLNEARSLFDGVELDDLLRVMKSKTRSRAVLYAINSHFGNAPKITMEDLQERGKGRKTTK
ncbi:MAG TPA: hypothetical protein VJI67_01975, partial [archaeon]|nr:hypothetical protein [archaeon]